MERTIFVSPYISIVDQKAQVVREVLEPKGFEAASMVLEHYSNWRRTGKLVQCGAG